MTRKKQPTKYIILLIGLVLLSQSLISTAYALEIFIPPASVTSGKTTKIQLKIDKTDNLAGVRLVLSFAHDKLHYVGAVKTSKTGQMMYVINDKKPGELIIVMATAQGIKGENFSLLDLSFKANPVKIETTSSLEIKEVQLMSDRLKDLPYKIRVSPVTISPAPSNDQ